MAGLAGKGGCSFQVSNRTRQASPFELESKPRFMKKLILKLFGFSREEIYLFESVKSARNVQDFLWGEYNSKWDLEEWKRMFSKRMVKIADIDERNPHAKIELKKRILQNTALGIAMLEKIDSDSISGKCDIPSNLPQYGTKNDDGLKS
jgi:hypothetical protein